MRFQLLKSQPVFLNRSLFNMEIYMGKWCWVLLALFDTDLKKAIFPSVEKAKKIWL
tara:strand:+ start:656 stop:823 length:168 start_codon:yes stop_codon:yes gene_type:complete